MFKKTYKAKNLAFHEMHKLWLLLQNVPGDTHQTLSSNIVALPGVFKQFCLLVYGSKTPIEHPMASLFVSKSLDKLEYFDFKEVMNG